ncbi:class I SAM-dependent rRNA methyltransferase [Stenotrophobium rhamnosiphilum]|uniref:RlmI/RlmK family 23S rRNA methyltransferase n=1 Tax=Stenotrophobium rhamnosiphilum TaxID=2029166 RepID=A0A2T5MKZ7_9GAMM|nr:class I SAM-dependent rRNA methyltransferase [Stenotrophobium rhamnosiphilum]PTU33234.1 RlmI/RlmK family 23S rRNA methyltransferase [Stenotrophobium rhamnosiphilum]
MLSIKLKAHEERRLRAGHLWVFSNEIDTGEGFRNIAAGSLCKVFDSRNKALGVGYINPKTLMAVRMLSSNANADINVEWFVGRIKSALALRERLYPTPHYRLIYGESDGLPGLIVDRYGDVLVVQMSTAGMDALKPVVIEALQSALKPRGILLRNDVAMRETEGLPLVVEEIGDVPDTVEIDESGVRFEIPLKTGQKTGWFYDQRDNRDRLSRYVRDARVLDVFSYIGGWAMRAHGFGAKTVSCIDSSAPALDAAQRNAQLNGATLETIKGSALDMLKQLRDQTRQFDVIIVDPPALIKRKKDAEAGLEHYASLNRVAMQLLVPGGILISCSCSHHLELEQLQRVLLREARTANRRLQILEQGGQGPDHPVHPAIPETRYLKGYICRVV